MKFVQAKNYYKGGNKPRLIVIHDMEYPERPQGAEWCGDFFAGAGGMKAPAASAHFAVDNNSVVQCVREEDGAWHTPGQLPAKGGTEINRMSIGIEHVGYARQTAEEWLDDYSMAMLELSAGLVAELCAKHNIPVKKLTAEDLRAGASGICGHVDCTKATGVGSHWDPGPNFPWDWYLARIKSKHPNIANLLPKTPSSMYELPKPGWVRIPHDGALWDVASVYLPFVSIGWAEDFAKANGYELPTPDMVDAVWRKADLRVDAKKLVRSDHNGTISTMASVAMFDSQAALLDHVIKEAAQDRTSWNLIAGCFKDIVQVGGKVGIYGWHRLDGTVIQPLYLGHSRGWIDYAQGLRLCKRVNQ